MNYQELKDYCTQVSETSKRIVDQGALEWVSKRHSRIVKEFLSSASVYRERGVAFNAPMLFTLTITYQAWQLFRSGGLITKYVKGSEYAALQGLDLEVLQGYERRPWSFRLFRVDKLHPHDFLTVVDELSGEKLLLQSKGITEAHTEQGPRLWFVLLLHNGRCYQTYGGLLSYPSFDLEDLYYFGGELGEVLDGPEALSRLINRNPTPFLMLCMASDLPRIVLKGEFDFVWHQAVDPMDVGPSMGDHEDRFSVKWNRNVFLLEPKDDSAWGKFPHYAKAYYDERRGELLRISQTEVGFEGLTSLLTQGGLELDPISDVAVSAGMLTAAWRVLGRPMRLDPYAQLFEVKEPKSEQMDTINEALRLMMDDVNAGTVPDFEAVALQSGLDVEECENLFRQISGMLDRP
jgi:hypothetical protein